MKRRTKPARGNAPSATKKPRAAPAAHESQAVVKVSLDIGDWLDVMDAEGTWNVAQVLRVVNAKEVEVKYDGWPAEFNEVVLINSDRVAPYHTYTWSVKCWAKYKNWPWWPSIVTIRAPGTLEGQKYLESEKRLFVDFMDGPDITERCRCWVDLSKVQPFSKLEDERRKRSTGSDFEASLGRVHLSTAVKAFPKFSTGTLPVQYRSEIAPPVRVMKKEMGTKDWAISVISNGERHRRVYRYKSVGGVALTDDEEDDGDEGDIVQFADLSDDGGDVDRPKKSRPGSKGKAPTKVKSVKKESADESPKSKRVVKLLDDVVKIEDSAEIIEGPHAPSPQREPNEQPVFLPLVDKQIVEGLHRSSDEDTGQNLHPRRGASASVSDGEVSRKRKSREMTTSASNAYAEVLEPTGSRDECDEIDEEHLLSSDFAFEGEATSVEGHSQERLAPGPPSTSKDAEHQEMPDRALVLDIDENDDSDAESDLIPLDPLDDVEVEPTYGTASFVDSSPPDVVVAPAPSQQVAPTDKILPQAIRADVAEDPVTVRVDDSATGPQTDGAPVHPTEAPQDVAETASPSLLSDSMAVPPKPPKSTRKSSKSLADQSIAAALAELEDQPAPSKKMRTSKSGKIASTAVAKSDCVVAPSGSAKASDSAMNITTPVKLATQESAPHQPDAVKCTVFQDTRDTTRRSSMRAAADATPGDGLRKMKGKTPVWVLPPPKFDHSSDHGPLSKPSPSILTAPAFPPPFSSLTLFGSTVDFSMSKWCKQAKYPQCMSQ